MQTQTMSNGTVEACCLDRGNRVTVPLPRAVIDSAKGGVPGKEQCRVCGRHHYTFAVDPVQFGMVGAAMGARGN